jgi:hypothetical protein
MTSDPRLRWLLVSLALALPAPSHLLAEDARLPGVQSTVELADPVLRALRKRMVAGGSLGTADLRALADAGDGLAAFKFAKFLDESATSPDEALSSRIHYYSIAAYTGRDFAVAPLLRLMTATPDPEVALGKTRLRGVEDALLASAGRGNGDAALALALAYAEGAPFGLDPEAAQKLLLRLADAGTAESSRAAMKLALLAIGPDPAQPVDPVAARAMLQIAANGPDLGARAMAENLERMLPPALAVEAAPLPAESVTQ